LEPTKKHYRPGFAIFLAALCHTGGFRRGTTEKASCHCTQ
jgi:hypothetical protein